MGVMTESIYHSIDACFIAFYRLSGIAFLDYVIGTLCVSLVAVVVGEISVSLAIRFNKKYNDRMGAEIDRVEKLSIAAYEAGDKEGYRALNKEATDAWGKHFFTMAAYSAGILWPIPFVLQWMQWRFADVTFPIAFPFSMMFEDGVGYLFTFFPIYILARIIFKRMRPWLPYFRGVQKMLDEASQPSSSSNARTAGNLASAGFQPDPIQGRSGIPLSP
jgi:hypothetical protein